MIVGLGNPGKGIPPSQSSALALASASASGGANQETQVVSNFESTMKGSGFPAGGITGLVLASIVVSRSLAGAGTAVATWTIPTSARTSRRTR